MDRGEKYQQLWFQANRINERPLQECLDDAESALSYFRQGKQVHALIEALILKAKILERMHYLEPSQKCVAEAEVLLKSNGDAHQQFELHYLKTRYHRLKGDWDLALYELLTALELDLPDTLGIIHYGFSIIYAKANDTAKAKSYLNSAMQHLDEYKQPEHWLNGMIEEGMLLTANGKYEEARSILLSLLTKAKDLRSVWHECVILNCLANIHMNLGEYQEALGLCKVILPKTIDFQYHTFECSLSASIALFAYFNGDHSKSIELFEEAIHKAKRIHHGEAIDFSVMHLARIYHEVGQNDLAFKWLNEHIYRVNKNNNKVRIQTFSRLIESRERELERVRANSQKIQDQNDQLRRWNDDFQQYSFILAHDLKEPIRNVSSFASLLQVKAQKELSSSSLKYLEQIMRGTKSMNSKLDSLIKYLELEKEPKAYRPFNLHAYLQELKANTDELTHSQDTFALPDPFGTLICHPAQLKKLFYELVYNAIKFRKPDEELAVEIHYNRNDRFHEFKVIDNGRGMDATSKDQVFQIFKKLKHQQPDHQGMGLAICHRIISLHDGSIDVDSNLGEGTTFTIQLPIAAELPELISQD
ncbi:MAG: ATP-binding protein [Bacteroidota bacterium]